MYRIAIIPGDGIGKEVMESGEYLLDKLDLNFSFEYFDKPFLISHTSIAFLSYSVCARCALLPIIIHEKLPVYKWVKCGRHDLRRVV